MNDPINIQASFEKGDLKVLKSLTLGKQTVKLEGAWAEFAPEEGISFEEIEEITGQAQKKSLEKLLQEME